VLGPNLLHFKPKEIFDDCHGAYRRCRRRAAHVGSLRLEEPVGGLSAFPGGGFDNRAAQYVADFELAGDFALRLQKGRLRLFHVYYCGRVNGKICEEVGYRRALRIVGIAPGTFDFWCEVIKEAVGKELERRKIWPVFAYFRPSSHDRNGNSSEAERPAWKSEPVFQVVGLSTMRRASSSAIPGGT
jgi:hypothetical protein